MLFLLDGFGSLQEYYQSGMVELLEFEGDYYNTSYWMSLDRKSSNYNY